MHYDILIITSNNINSNIFLPLTSFVIDNCEVKENFSITINNEMITFDYILTDRLIPNFRIIKEDKKIITNQYFETSVDNIYAFGNIINSDKSVDQQLEIIKTYLILHE